MDIRDFSSPRSKLNALFHPRNVAIVGASADPMKTGGRPIAYLQKHNFSGGIFPINPKVDQISGLKSYGTVADLPVAPDVGIVLLGAERAHLAVNELAALGTKVAIVLASGYSESGPAGVERQGQLLRAAGDMRILGPNTIGAINLNDGIMLSATGALELDELPIGGVSVASQSGGILGALLSRGAARGIGFAKLASSGNEADIDIADLIEELAYDPATTVIAAYIEGIRHPDHFRRAARLAQSMDKPIVVFKVGRSESGARSAISHTGAMAGEDRVYDALFRQLGILRAETFSDLLDLSAMLASGRRLKGRRIGILTSTGGAGSLVADSCGMSGLDVPLLDEPTTAKFNQILGGETAVSVGNPVDVTLAGVKPEIMTAATRALLEADNIDAVVVVVGSSALAHPNIAVGAIDAGASSTDKPLIAYVSPYAPEILKLLNMRSIPAFTTPEACAMALTRARSVPLRSPDDTRLPSDASHNIVQMLPSGPLNEAEARDLFASFGIGGAQSQVVNDGAEAVKAATDIGEKVVLKVLSRHIAHKSDVGGVRVGLSAKDVAAALEEMKTTLATHSQPSPEGFLVQRMLRGGTEMILGFRRDPQLGPLVLLGAGGVAAEVFDDVSIRLLPVTRADAQGMVEELRSAKLLNGFRGQAHGDVNALIDAIVAFASMGEVLGDRLVEAEINPLFVLPAGEGVAAADALAVIA